MKFRPIKAIFFCVIFFHLFRICTYISRTIKMYYFEDIALKPLLDFNYKMTDSSENVSYVKQPVKTILYFNEERKRKLPLINLQHEESCGYTKCIFTRDKSKLDSADAVIFTVGNRKDRLGDPPIPAHLRNPDQVWIFMSADPPRDYYNEDYKSPAWHNTMNWSILYRIDSDIPHPFGSFITQEKVRDIDYEAAYNEKTRNALWLVRQCQSSSARRQYINEMVRHGFEVDMMGECGNEGGIISPEELDDLIPKYKFYLGFEKALCKDYVTEKLFRHFNRDWIIVVRGGADYERLLPTNVFVNTDDFYNVSHLVTYLTDLGNNKEKYVEFLRRKEHYKSIITNPVDMNCEVCRRLNNLSKFRKTYNTLDNYLNDGQCVRPLDF